MVVFRRQGWGFGVAFAAALMLVLQTAAAALAIGQGTPPLDIFGNPLCITSATDHTAPAKSDHPSLPECCTLGCNMFSTAMAMPPDGVALPVTLQFPMAAAFVHVRRDPPTAAKHDPGSPRAPPPAA
ncbi:hypothetical protein [Aminobacter niigataensis]|uniref:DUF2946 domain-containing protein n=1 Tax=Aminobacter niigataensis TaxID=83265 RepID=A0ABR6L4B7_9HYPH|nr:hypothetical protein [Aminobacter niigataensis]MBB4651656.1 hypothetical protein [Aminobacter niigataensis]CAI2932309.1 conserved exported protein of unknown function [Aminobacter niigataensis]